MEKKDLVKLEKEKLKELAKERQEEEAKKLAEKKSREEQKKKAEKEKKQQEKLEKEAKKKKERGSAEPYRPNNSGRYSHEEGEINTYSEFDPSQNPFDTDNNSPVHGQLSQIDTPRSKSGSGRDSGKSTPGGGSKSNSRPVSPTGARSRSPEPKIEQPSSPNQSRMERKGSFWSSQGKRASTNESTQQLIKNSNDYTKALYEILNKNFKIWSAETKAASKSSIWPTILTEIGVLADRFENKALGNIFISPIISHYTTHRTSASQERFFQNNKEKNTLLKTYGSLSDYKYRHAFVRQIIDTMVNLCTTQTNPIWIRLKPLLTKDNLDDRSQGSTVGAVSGFKNELKKLLPLVDEETANKIATHHPYAILGTEQNAKEIHNIIKEEQLKFLKLPHEKLANMEKKHIDTIDAFIKFFDTHKADTLFQSLLQDSKTMTAFHAEHLFNYILGLADDSAKTTLVQDINRALEFKPLLTFTTSEKEKASFIQKLQKMCPHSQSSSTAFQFLTTVESTSGILANYKIPSQDLYNDVLRQLFETELTKNKCENIAATINKMQIEGVLNTSTPAWRKIQREVTNQTESKSL